ncbi:ABC transporter ATP-binding protein [Celeribacter indicus]|uniref:Branched chain amino acid ABC transporter ATPase n=1 Tax=Celeribacter indicus TaxID=1208324 RepID=A0A0B5E821_9RHOB|nr:ABC transporter ATP-binding protein [Celeribacter indicus]AJE49156.1 branched chain amino acid ABC transporter ATPase [Celeribacter indicus]SDX17749.1 amino acid/amide ABC transporter ATP-binding protein 1, HAAT family [Celeribacter indicus]
MVSTAERSRAAPGGAAPAPILNVSGLGRRFGAFVAVKGVDIRVEEGSIHALIGPNGAGKTTVFSMLSGFLKPTEGRIEYRGTDITGAGPTQVARRGMIRSFQISATFAHLSVHENVRVALQRKAGLAYQFWSPESRLDRLDARVAELLAEVGLAAERDTLAVNLSYGRKRMLEIATTLAVDPDLLLLDEPMAGMAHEDVERVVELIRRISDGRTILMVEHNLSVVRNLCDRITVLQRGEVIAEGSYAQVSANPQVREAYIGTEA